MFIWIAIVIVVIICVILVVVNSSSDTRRIVPLLDPQPDLDDCSKYYDSIGALRQCPLEQRYDHFTKECQNYYLVNCGMRPNPPYAQTEQLCELYANESIIGQKRYPVKNAQYYAACNTGMAGVVTRCDGKSVYDIPSETCLDDAVIGSRCTGEDCPIE